MMCKRLAALLLVLLLIPAVPCRAERTRYVLLCDAQTGARADAVAVLQRYMLYASWECDFLDVAEASSLAEYDGILLCIGEEQSLPEETVRAIKASGTDVFILGGGGLSQLAPDAAFLTGDVMLRIPSESGADNDLLLMDPGLWLLPESGSALEDGLVYVDGTAYPLCRRVGQVTHFAWFSADEPLVCAQLVSCIQRWQWPYENEPTAYGQYFVLDYAYPFLDPAGLLERTAVLAEEGVPYCIAVTAIFSNGEYPAMKRFCEVLRYEQNRGTGVILRVPFVTIGQVESEELLRHMDIAYEAYAAYGVYPLAIQAPVSWMFCEEGLAALRGYRTVFLFETEEDLTRPELDRNLAFADGHQVIAPAWSDDRAFSASYAQAFYLDASMDVEELRTTVQRLKTSRRVFKSLRAMENIVYSGDIAVTGTADGAIAVNGKRADLTYVPFEYETNYTFDRGITQFFKEQIETSNRWVMIFVIVSCTVFIIMMVLFRRQIRRELVLGKRQRKGKDKKTEAKDPDVGV